jgi:formate hydrogenlyase transcriptional activator
MVAMQSSSGFELEHYRALLEVSKSILANREPEPLFHELARLLERVVRFDFLTVVLHDPQLNAMRLYILSSANSPERQPPYDPTPIEESPAGWVWQNQTALMVPDTAVESRWPRVLELLRANRIRSCCFLPLTTARRRLGAMGFAFVEPHSFDASEVGFMESVASQVAVAFDNALVHSELERDRDRLEVLLDISNALVSTRAERDLFRTITSCLARITPHDYASLALYRPESGELSLRALEFPRGSGLIYADATVPFEGSPASVAIARREPVRFDAEWLANSDSKASQALAAEGMQSLVCLPLITRNGILGTLNLGSFAPGAFSGDDLSFLGRVSMQVAIAVENAIAFREITRLKDRLSEEKLYLEDEIRSEFNFAEMVGESQKFRRILKQVNTVAPTPATVLILGETGTGKELIARAIHDRSERKDSTFVKINCAAIPSGLLESELFGHERGAFTGAVAQKIGRLELAGGGTLLLDEVGEIPLVVQPKLLRALQEHEFERLGSTRTVRVDVRLVAATNRDLSQMVADREFRADLFYRLNVFPIQLPPLRQRRDDIPLLVRHFAAKYAKQMGRRIETIPAATMERLSGYHWPGNVRELENLIERAVILSPGPVLRVPELESPAPALSGSLEAAERAHISHTLKTSGWVISGPRGAAARLGLKRTTLQSKMKKLGIVRP